MPCSKRKESFVTVSNAELAILTLNRLGRRIQSLRNACMQIAKKSPSDRSQKGKGSSFSLQHDYWKAEEIYLKSRLFEYSMDKIESISWNFDASCLEDTDTSSEVSWLNEVFSNFKDHAPNTPQKAGEAKQSKLLEFDAQVLKPWKPNSEPLQHEPIDLVIVKLEEINYVPRQPTKRIDRKGKRDNQSYSTACDSKIQKEQGRDKGHSTTDVLGSSSKSKELSIKTFDVTCETMVTFHDKLPSSQLYVKVSKDITESSDGSTGDGQTTSFIKRVTMFEAYIIIMKETRRRQQGQATGSTATKPEQVVQTIYLFHEKQPNAIFSYLIDSKFEAIMMDFLLLTNPKDQTKSLQLLVVGKDMNNSGRITLQYVLANEKKFKNILISSHAFTGSPAYLSVKTNSAFFEMAFVIANHKVIYFRFRNEEHLWYDKIKENNSIISTQFGGGTSNLVDVKFDTVDSPEEFTASSKLVTLVRTDHTYKIVILIGEFNRESSLFKHRVHQFVDLESIHPMVYSNIEYNSAADLFLIAGLSIPENLIDQDINNINIKLVCMVEGKKETIANSARNMSFTAILQDDNWSNDEIAELESIKRECKVFRARTASILPVLTSEVQKEVKALRERHIVEKTELTEKTIRQKIEEIVMKHKIQTIPFFHKIESKEEAYQSLIVWNENEATLRRFVSVAKPEPIAVISEIDILSCDLQGRNSETSLVKAKPTEISWITKCRDKVVDSDPVTCVFDCKVISAYITNSTPQ